MAGELAVSDMFKHMVILCWRKTEHGDPSVADFMVGFLVEVRDEWYIVTAGHIITALQGEQKDGLRHYNWLIHDGLSADSQWNNGIPFPLFEQRCVFINEPGIDFAAIFVPHLIRESLKCNQKIPFIESTWADPRVGGEYVGYLMLGAPAEKLVERSPHRLFFGLAMIHLNRIKPSESPEYDGKSDLYFHGKLKAVPITTRGGEVIESLRGMSGGPVIKFMKHPSGETTYKVIAVQSGWTGTSGIITATYVRPMLMLIQESVESESTIL
jgi:hypothetical protein